MLDVTYRKCLRGHVELISAQEAQRLDQAVLLSPENIDTVLRGRAFSMWAGFTCLAAAGIVHLFPHRAVAWALLANDMGVYMLPATRKIKAFLAFDPTPRIETTVRADFTEGHRLACLIGMQLETPKPLRMHGASGEDEMMYARIR